MFKILVIDDDRALARSVCAYLAQCGYAPTACESAEEAFGWRLLSASSVLSLC